MLIYLVASSPCLHQLDLLCRLMRALCSMTLVSVCIAAAADTGLEAHNCWSGMSAKVCRADVRASGHLARPPAVQASTLPAHAGPWPTERHTTTRWWVAWLAAAPAWHAAYTLPATLWLQSGRMMLTACSGPYLAACGWLQPGRRPPPLLDHQEQLGGELGHRRYCQPWRLCSHRNGIRLRECSKRRSAACPKHDAELERLHAPAISLPHLSVHVCTSRLGPAGCTATQ